MKRNLQILQYFKLIGKVFAITCLFVLLQTNNKAIAYYQTPEFSVTLKCVGWTNPLDTTVVNATMSIREWATNSIYIRNFSNSFREIFIPFRSKPTIGYNYSWLEASLLRWDDGSSCGVDGYVELYQYDTLNKVFSGFINFEPACYFAPRYRRVLGYFSYSEAKPELNLTEYHKSNVVPETQLNFALQFSIGGKENIPNADIFCINPFISETNETNIGKTNNDGILVYTYKVPQNTKSGEYTFKFRAVKDTLRSGTIESIVTVLDSFKLYIFCKPTEVTEVEAGKEASYILSVQDDNGDPVSDAKILCQNKILSDNFILVGLTNEKGEFTYKFKIPANTTAKDYTLKFYALKEKYINSEIIERNITVTPANLRIVLIPTSDIEVAEKDSLSFIIYVRDSQNKPVAKANVYYKNPIESNNFRLLAITDSIAKLNYGYRIPENKEGEYDFAFYATKDDISTDTIMRKVVVTKGTKCWTYGNFEFCIEGKGVWEPIEKTTKLKTEKRVVINSFLVFEGKMTIDTAQLGISCDGNFFVRNIPIPGGGIGTFSLASGKYELKLLGEDGKITNFINSYTSNIAGFKFKLKDIQLVGGRQAEGIKITATITVPGISVGCNEDDEIKETEFEVKDFEIKTTGIEIGGFKVENLGFSSFPQFCLSKLYGEYDSERDRLDFGANVKIPFGEVGAGIAFIGGELDSLGFRMEASFPPLFVIGTTTVGISGFFGHISGITQPNLEFELGGILVDVLIEDLYKIDISGYFKTPNIIGLKGEANLFKDPILKKWQMKGGIDGSIDIAIAQMELKGSLNIGTKDEEKYLLSTEGSLKYNMRQSKFSGYLSGTLDLPKMRDDWPFDWINATIGLPKKISADARFLFGKSKILWGEAKLGSKIGNLRYVVDLNKSYDDPDFFFFERTPEQKLIKSNNTIFNGNATYNFSVKNSTERFVTKIVFSDVIANSELVSPTGIKYKSEDKPENTVIYSYDNDAKKAFWTLINPESGIWTLNINTNTQNVNVKLYEFVAKPNFSVYLIQNLKEVNIYWNTEGLNSNGKVEIYLDSDKEGENGLHISTFNALDGYGKIILSDSLPDCKYYLYAIYNGLDIAIADYADEQIINNKSSLLPPTNITAKFLTKNDKCVIEWEPSREPNVIGYIIVGETPTGEEVLLATASKYERRKEFEIDDYSKYRIKIYSYNFDGLKGCSSVPIDIILSNSDFIENKPNSLMQIYPNPANSKVSISFNLEKPAHVKMKILNLVGKEVGVLIDNKWMDEGSHQISFDLKDLSPSVYFVILQAGEKVYTQKVQIIK